MASSSAYCSFVQSMTRDPQETDPQITDSPNISYRSFAPAPPQQCSNFLSHFDELSISQQNVHSLCASVNVSSSGSGSNEFKPALPPKPSSGPPVYREPPCPPVTDDAGVPQQSLPHPDICINSAPSPNRRIERPSPPVCPAPPNERPEGIGSRTQAWVQEHKSSGKLVGEKLSSLQRKLRSLLSQTPSTKDTVDCEKATSLRDDPRIIRPSSELSQRPNTGSIPFRVNHPSKSEQRLSYVSTSSIASVPASVSHPVSHGQRPSTFQQLESRHPFGAPLNISEQEDVSDTVQLRDTCSKFFTREPRNSWTTYLSPRNCYSNNIKSTYDYDKLAPKEVIGRPSQEKKAETPSSHPVYEGVTPFPSFGSAEILKKQCEQSQPSQESDGTPHHACRTHNSGEDSNLPDVTAKSSTKASTKERTRVASERSPCGTMADCADVNDLYKSSSESGRGTMHGSKGLVSPHSSGVSATSNLDTSLDSDHSASGTLWDQQNHCTLAQENVCSEDCKNKQIQHVYETPNVPSNCRPADKEEIQDDVSSVSLSVTPPLPPLSPAPSPPESVDNSPKISSKTKYKLSLSASALNSCYSKNDQQKGFDSSKSNPGLAISSSKSTPGKKSGDRRNSSITQLNCKHWGGKNKSQCSRAVAGSSMHRLGLAHGNFPSKKSMSSSRIHLGFPCHPDIDPELTSTTTGLDMESLLDDAEDYSSDLSATASTMDPNEVSMIRKQLDGLETMYSEILRLLGVKNNACKGSICSSGNPLDVSRFSRRKLNGSLSSLTGRSSLSRGNHSFADKRGFSEKRRMKDTRNSPASKRLQRLESHVVTLARSVAHLSSEMRTQHVLVQELENMRRDVTWVQERLRLMQLAQGCHSSNNGVRSQPMSLPRDWDNFRREVLELLNPSRAKKLTKFFGDEPPLIRQFLKRLGYEKYATNFEAEKIGIKELPYLTEERLQKMGLPMGPRIRILQEAHACCQQNQYKLYIV